MPNLKQIIYYFLGCIFIFYCFFNTKVELAQKNIQPSLTFGFLPYLTAGEIMEKYTPLATYLSEQINQPIFIKVLRSYDDLIQQAGDDQFDIFFMGGNPYIKMVERYGKKPLLARYEINGNPNFHSVIFVPKNSPLQKMSDLAGKRFAFGNRYSTLSALVPHYMLSKAGVTLSQLAGYNHLKSHQDVIFGVLIGNYAAGGVALEVFQEYKNRGIRALALSPPISTHLLIASNNLPAELVKQLQIALYRLKDKTILSAISTELTGFVPVTDADYDLLRTILTPE